MTPTLAQKVDKVLVAIKDANHFLGLANERVSILQDFADARSELANASNAIDDAMGLIDKLTAPEPTAWDDPHLP